MSSGATERFAELLARPEAEVPLDLAALVIAEHAHPGLDVERSRARLDDLAAGLGAAGAAPDAGALAHRLFVTEGFVGNAADYADPRNSYLDDVLERKLGIPITLSVVMLEVGRRVGLSLFGVGMPGHFLVRTGGADDRDDPAAADFFDPFDAGRRLSAAGCADRFASLYPSARFDPAFLAPVGPRAIVSRMLANLEQTLLAREPAAAVWVVRLELLVPGLPAAARRRFAARLGSLGAFAEAADVLDALAAESDPDGDVDPATPGGTTSRRDGLAARALRARAN